MYRKSLQQRDWRTRRQFERRLVDGLVTIRGTGLRVLNMRLFLMPHRQFPTP
jgi:hypothetical protein